MFDTSTVYGKTYVTYSFPAEYLYLDYLYLDYLFTGTIPHYSRVIILGRTRITMPMCGVM